MSRYTADAKCSKCGSRSVDTRHVSSPSRMVRTCGRCGHWWTEEPLDAPQRMEDLPERNKRELGKP